MKTDVALRLFAEFLTSGWKEMRRLVEGSDQTGDPIEDYMQANWEILVEAVLFPGGSGFLEVYGEGADCNDTSSRVFLPEAKPTHRVVCSPQHGGHLRDLGSDQRSLSSEMIFWGFVHWDGRTYETVPPFNAVLLEGTENMVVDLDEIEFDLEEIGSI